MTLRRSSAAACRPKSARRVRVGGERRVSLARHRDVGTQHLKTFSVSEMAAGPKAWFLATSTPSTTSPALGCTEQKEARGGQDYVEQLTHSVTHVLVLHKNESV